MIYCRFRFLFLYILGTYYSVSRIVGAQIYVLVTDVITHVEKKETNMYRASCMHAGSCFFTEFPQLFHKVDNIPTLYETQASDRTVQRSKLGIQTHFWAVPHNATHNVLRTGSRWMFAKGAEESKQRHKFMILSLELHPKMST